MEANIIMVKKVPNKTEFAEIALSVGGNVGDVKQNIYNAIEELKWQGVINIKLSSFYETEPVNCPDNSPNFINAAIIAKTQLSPQELLLLCKKIESISGRAEKYERNSPRPLDLDIILYDDLILNTENLVIPHKEAINRMFVLEPLAEIAKDLIFPTTNLSVKEHLEILKNSQLNSK